MDRLIWLALVLLLVLSAASPAVAGMVMIQTTAPLQDHAEESINTAFEEAVQTAVRGALAMGFSWVKLNKALVLQDIVNVQILATDTKPEREAGEEEEPWQGGRLCAGSAMPGGPDL